MKSWRYFFILAYSFKYHSFLFSLFINRSQVFDNMANWRHVKRQYNCPKEHKKTHQTCLQIIGGREVTKSYCSTCYDSPIKGIKILLPPAQIWFHYSCSDGLLYPILFLIKIWDSNEHSWYELHKKDVEKKYLKHSKILFFRKTFDPSSLYDFKIFSKHRHWKHTDYETYNTNSFIPNYNFKNGHYKIKKIEDKNDWSYVLKGHIFHKLILLSTS